MLYNKIITSFGNGGHGNLNLGIVNDIVLIADTCVNHGCLVLSALMTLGRCKQVWSLLTLSEVVCVTYRFLLLFLLRSLYEKCLVTVRNNVQHTFYCRMLRIHCWTAKRVRCL